MPHLSLHLQRSRANCSCTCITNRNSCTICNWPFMLAQCNRLKVTVLLICLVALHFLYHPPVTVVINDCQPLVYTFILSFIPIIMLLKWFPYTSITLNHSLCNLLIPSQRLVIMSVSLHTRTVLCCLIIQVLNIKSLLSKCLSHFCIL